MHRSIRLFLAPALLVTAGTALAGPAGDNAQAHFRAIAAGQVETALGQYADHATLAFQKR